MMVGCGLGVSTSTLGAVVVPAAGVAAGAAAAAAAAAAGSGSSSLMTPTARPVPKMSSRCAGLNVALVWVSLTTNCSSGSCVVSPTIGTETVRCVVPGTVLTDQLFSQLVWGTKSVLAVALPATCGSSSVVQHTWLARSIPVVSPWSEMVNTMLVVAGPLPSWS